MTKVSLKPGATLHDGGATFVVHSTTADRVDLCLFGADDGETARIHLRDKSGDLHHAFVAGIEAGQRYGLRAHGRYSPADGDHFDSSKLLVDPYAKAIAASFTYTSVLSRYGADTAALVPKGIVAPDFPDLIPRTVPEPSLIYELNVRGFTMRHPEVPPSKRGTIAALAEPAVISHLKSIGADCIELMPIAAWIDERHLVNLGLRNAWGYNPISFFAVEPRLAPGGLVELRDTVSRLQAEGISVILDVVFNHTGESDALGPTLSFRGLDNSYYYRLFHGAYINDAGTGNVLALDRPRNIELVVDVLRHWVLQAGIDGFRFDLATILGRDDHGFRTESPLIQAIESDPVLASRILIAEPWDIGLGGYQLGNFPARWLEWNDKYRDDVRRFWRGDNWSANALATRLSGSSDVFLQKGRPSRSVNFVAAHDGFTLHDLLHFHEKQNLPNGEDNRDGKQHEVTCIGATAQALLATLALSRGTPMITAGDEFGRTQGGNNNAYAQDNDTTWLDWKERDKPLSQVFSSLMAIRKRYAAFFGDDFLSADDVEWLDEHGRTVNWQAPDNRVLLMVLRLAGKRICIAVNGSDREVPFDLKPVSGRAWHNLLASGAELPGKSVLLFEER